jgi:hypothetical protein
MCVPNYFHSFIIFHWIFYVFHGASYRFSMCVHIFPSALISHVFHSFPYTRWRVHPGIQMLVLGPKFGFQDVRASAYVSDSLNSVGWFSMCVHSFPSALISPCFVF